MPRVISFILLLAITLLVGAVFFQVMAQFLVPLFLACVLLVVLLPTSWLGWKAFTECQRVYHILQQGEESGAGDSLAWFS